MMSTQKTTRDANDDFMRRRRKRSIAIGVALAILVAIFYAITVAKLGPGIMVRDL